MQIGTITLDEATVEWMHTEQQRAGVQPSQGVGRGQAREYMLARRFSVPVRRAVALDSSIEIYVTGPIGADVLCRIIGCTLRHDGKDFQFHNIAPYEHQGIKQTVFAFYPEA